MARPSAWHRTAPAGQTVRGGRQGVALALRAEQHHLATVDVDRIADAQHRHAPHGPTIDVHGARGFAEFQPGAAAVDAQLREHLRAVGDGRELAVIAAAQAMLAGTDRDVGLGRFGEAQSQGIHR